MAHWHWPDYSVSVFSRQLRHYSISIEVFISKCRGRPARKLYPSTQYSKRHSHTNDFKCRMFWRTSHQAPWDIWEALKVSTLSLQLLSWCVPFPIRTEKGAIWIDLVVCFAIYSYSGGGGSSVLLNKMEVVGLTEYQSWSWREMSWTCGKNRWRGIRIWKETSAEAKKGYERPRGGGDSTCSTGRHSWPVRTRTTAAPTLFILR